MVASAIIITASAILAFFASRNQKRRALFWVPISFLFPVTLLFLLQVRKEEKIGKELITRCVAAVLLTAVAYVSLETIRPGNGIKSYETLVLDHASSIMNVLDQSHFRTGYVFQMPSITMEAPSGNSAFYLGFVLSTVALISTVFVRSAVAIVLPIGIVVFGFLGHILSATTFATIFSAVDSPELLRPDTLKSIALFNLAIGTSVLFASYLAFAYFSGKRKSTQNRVATGVNSRGPHTT